MKVIILFFLLIVPAANALEGGMSLYPLGLIGPQAAVLPDPGTYFSVEVYSYSGDLKKTTRDHRIYQNSELEISYDFLTYTYVAERKIQSGTPFFSATVPYVNTELEGSVTGSFPDFGNVSNFNFNKSTGGIGDSFFTTGLGWERDYFHYGLQITAYAPTGNYDKEDILNVSLNRWGVQPTGTFTYKNESNGIEMSAALGYMVNFENTDTEYNSGDELNFELALIQHFSDTFYMGLLGQGNQQVTGDSGQGALLGENKGQVYGAGLTLGGLVPIRNQHILNFNLRYYNEFNAVRRFEGEGFYLSGSINF